MNIEKTISEHAVSDILTPMLESQDRIVTEDVAPLFDQATGLDTPPASGTVTTTIEESRSVITAIIRKAWTATLTMLGGASVLSSIAAAYTYLRNRLQGNETYGIPDRRSEISASSPLAANLALLNDRKITNGNAENDGIADGMSLARLVCDSSVRDSVKSIIDDSSNGWVMTDSLPDCPNLEELELQCTTANKNVKIAVGISSLKALRVPRLKSLSTTGVHISSIGVEGEFVLPEFTSYYNSGGGDFLCYMPNVEIIRMPKCTILSGDRPVFFNNCAKLEEVYLEKLTTLGGMSEIAYTGSVGAFNNNPKLWKVEFGVYPNIYFRNGGGGAYSPIPTEQVGYFRSCPNLIHLEADIIDRTIYLNDWSPTNALDASKTDLIEEGSTAENNLQQFLSNFREYIAKKLTDNGSGKTLTLSQAVFSEIWDSQGQPQVKGDGLDELRADIHRIVRTRKQWAVNKA